MANEKNVSEASKTALPQNEVQASIDQLNLETAEINRQLAVASLEAKRAELESLHEKNREAAERRARIQQKQRNAAESDRRLKQDRDFKQGYCNHSQGGEGLDGMFQGEGVHTTYQLETTVTGAQYFRCVRCEKEVHQFASPEQFAKIKTLPHKGLRGPVPILFVFKDARGNIVLTDPNGQPIDKK